MELTTSQGDHVTSAVDSSTKKGIWFPKQIHFFVKLSTAEMMWSPCDVVSSTIIFSFIGDVCICQIIFKATGITSAMVLPEAARRIPHLLISTAENGVSTHQTFLAGAQEFDKYLELKGIQRPVVLLSDGHGSRLNHNVLFLLFKQIQLFVTPPDTTGVTQFLDQLNKNIYQKYKRRGSAQYWEEKFNQAMGIIDELHKKSIQLKEIPGFMTIQKVKPKLSKKNT